MINYLSLDSVIYVIIHSGDTCGSDGVPCPQQEFGVWAFSKDGDCYSCGLFTKQLNNPITDNHISFDEVKRCKRCVDRAKSEPEINIENLKVRLGKGFPFKPSNVNIPA